MRRRACTLALLAATSLAAASPARSASPRVAALQLVLFQRGYYAGPFDGIAGLETRRATRHFQRRHHLAPDGVAGPRTRRKLGRWARHELGDRQLGRGRRGWDVAELQFLLRRRPPEDEHDWIVLAADGGDGGVRELLPALAAVRVRLVGADREDGVQQQHALSRGNPRRDGGVDIKAAGSDHMGHIMEVTGTEASHGGYHALYVTGLKK